MGEKRKMLFLCMCIILTAGCSNGVEEAENIVAFNEVHDIETFQFEDYLAPEIMQKDFEFLVDKILELHPDPERNLDIEWDEFVQQTKEQLNEPLAAGDFAMKLMSFTSQLQDAHTEVYPSSIESRRLPLRLEWVKEGLMISESFDQQFQKGDLLLKIDTYTIEDIQNHMSKIVSAENEYWIKEKGKNFLLRELFLRGLLDLDDDTITLTIERDNQELTRTVKLVEKVNKSSHNHKDWFYWEIKEDTNVGYFNLNESKVTTEYEENVQAFFEKVDEYDIENVVIDLRKNVGGNSAVMDPFLNYVSSNHVSTFSSVVKYSEEAGRQRNYEHNSGIVTYPSEKMYISQGKSTFKGNIYILTSASTYSSGNMFAVFFHDNKLATIIGEPTGNSPSAFGDTIGVELPNTKFSLSIPYKEFIRPDTTLKSETTLYPDHLVEKKREDFINQKDGQLERILMYISSL